MLTVNDPVGMNAVDDADRGQAAGIINTAEQMGGAIGIAGLGALQLGYYFHLLYCRLAARVSTRHPLEYETVALHRRSRAEGPAQRLQPPIVRNVFHDLVQATPTHFNSRSTPPPGVALVGAMRLRRAGPPSSRGHSTTRSSAGDPGGSRQRRRHPRPDPTTARGPRALSSVHGTVADAEA